MSLYTKIIQAWDNAHKGDPTKPPNLLEKEYTRLARELEEQLAERFKEPIQQFNDGLISSTELLQKLSYEAHKE
jgi:hypothetical protein